jgi:hypothetical protein
MRLCASTVFPRFDFPLLIAGASAQVHFSLGFTPATVSLQLLIPRVAQKPKVVLSQTLSPATDVQWRVPRRLPAKTILSLSARPPLEDLSPRDAQYLARLRVNS